MAEREETPRETGCAVLGVFGALVLFALAVAGVWFAFPSERVAPEAVLAELFDAGELPFGLVLEDGGVVARGKQVARLVDPTAPPEPEPLPRGLEGLKDADEDAEEDSDDAESPRPDPSAPPPEGESGTPPREVLVLHFPTRGGAREVAKLFQPPGANGGERGRGGPPRGGGFGPSQKFVLERGFLSWLGEETPFLHQRELLGMRGWRDVVRVDVSRPGRPCALVARWTLNHPASTERLEELLAALPPAAEDS